MGVYQAGMLAGNALRERGGGRGSELLLLLERLVLLVMLKLRKRQVMTAWGRLNFSDCQSFKMPHHHAPEKHLNTQIPNIFSRL